MFFCLPKLYVELEQGGSQACDYRKEVSKLQTSAMNTLETIERGNNEWEWADNDPNRGKLASVVKKLKAKLVGFGAKFISEDVKEVKIYDTATSRVTRMCC